MAFASPPRTRFTAETMPPSPSRAEFSSVPSSPFVATPSWGGSPTLIDRIAERKRAALGDLSNNGETASAVAGRRIRARMEVSAPTPSHEEDSGDKVAVQRFTLVSRGAPPAKRAPPQQSVLSVPSRVATQLGSEVSICRCSECDRSGLRRRMSGTRLCRRDTEAHPEYALLLLMSERFENECSDRGAATPLVTEACCREKTAYFILGAGNTTVGYVAAEVMANRRAKRLNDSVSSEIGEEQVDDTIPTVVQIYVEPEFRRKGYATEALKLLLRDHESLRLDDPSPEVARIVEQLGFVRGGVQEGAEGRPLTSYVRTFDFVEP